MNISKVRNKVEQCRGKYQSIKENINITKESLIDINERMLSLEKAQVVVQEVSRVTQKEVEYNVSDLVSHGLAAVFNNPYTYVLEYVLRRDKTEADQRWMRGNDSFLPNGGGVRDVSAFALHIACVVLSLMQNKSTRPVLFLDEPFKHLKPSSLQERAGIMLQEISNSLNVQIVLITHDEVLSQKMDSIYKITIDRKVSHAEQLRETNKQDHRSANEKQQELDGVVKASVQTRTKRSSNNNGKHKRSR